MTRVARVDRGQRGYLLVLFVVIIAFVGVAAAMQVLVLTSVGTTSRAYDSYRQGATEAVRLRRAVAEALLAHAQISVGRCDEPLGQTLARELAQLSPDATTVTPTLVPDTLPVPSTFPDPLSAPDPLSPTAPEVTTLLTPELARLVGPRAASYPALTFEFASERRVLGAARTYRSRVTAHLLAVPLTRFAVAAYELPADIGAAAAGTSTPGPVSSLPGGLVPARDAAFIRDLQAAPGVLPYGYRHRAVQAAAYQYVFSPAFIDRLAEYAGITHFHRLDTPGSTAVLAGMTAAGPVATFDVGIAGTGSFGPVTMARDAVVVFTEKAGHTLRLKDSTGTDQAGGLFLLLLGPSDTATAPLTLELSSIARPVVIVACHVRITAPAGVAVNGAVLLDPTSSMAPAGPITVGHLSYWAGSCGIPANAVVATAMPPAAEALAPRVVYVATAAERL